MQLKNETDDNLVMDVINNMSSNEKELERLKRDKNLFELEKKRLEKELDKISIENTCLKKRESTLTALENSLPQRIKKYKENNAPKEVIMELQYINDMLTAEKEKLLNKEVEDEEI
ncbi:MAG: hypothetical protein ACI31S_02000 [Bacilli bacterium]